MSLLRRWRERRRRQKAEAKAIAAMRRDEEPGTAAEPQEVKLSQLRD